MGVVLAVKSGDCSVCMHMGAKCQGQQVLLSLTPILTQAASIVHSSFQPKTDADCQLHGLDSYMPGILLMQCLTSVSIKTTLTGTQTMADCNAFSQSV